VHYFRKKLASFWQAMAHNRKMMISKILVLSFLLAFPQETSDTFRNIEIAMKAGSARELVKLFNDTVELKIDGDISNYSRNQSEVVLRKFFQQHPARNFSYIHQGSSPEGLRYAIGKYEFDGGSYRVVMFLKEADGSYKIDTLNFTRE
jgi:hypothetical protein